MVYHMSNKCLLEKSQLVRVKLNCKKFFVLKVYNLFLNERLLEAETGLIRRSFLWAFLWYTACLGTISR